MGRKPIIVKIGDRERTVKYDLNALCLFEEETGLPLDQALKSMKMKNIGALLGAGLIHKDPFLTIDDIGRIEYLDLQEIIPIVTSALTPKTDGERPIVAPESVSTGNGSGASGDMIYASVTPNSGG